MSGRDSMGRGGWTAGSQAAAERMLIGACAAIWLMLLGISVAATVALVDLGSGHRGTTRGPHTPWPLYVVIIVSALIIVSAIPLLLRARREALARPVVRSAGTAGRATEKHPVFGPIAALDRIWLRGTVALVGIMGVALVAVAVATYLMAAGKDVASWAGYGVAGVVTGTMPVAVWLYLRQLADVPASGRRAG